MDKPKILMVLGSTREGRLGVNVGKWMHEELSKDSGMELEYIDLKDFELPMFGESMNENVKIWNEKVAAADGFIFVTPEYNHGYSSVLKNAIDYAKEGWFYKPVAMASYSIGPFGGVRAVEQLRQVTAELRMFGLRDGLHIPFVQKVFNQDGTLVDTTENERLAGFVAPLKYWSVALRDDREGALKI